MAKGNGATSLARSIQVTGYKERLRAKEFMCPKMVIQIFYVLGADIFSKVIDTKVNSKIR